MAETEPKLNQVVPSVEYCQVPVPVDPVTAVPFNAPLSISVTDDPNKLLIVVADDVSFAMIVPNVLEAAVSTGASFTPVIVIVTRAVSVLPLPSEIV